MTSGHSFGNILAYPFICCNLFLINLNSEILGSTVSNQFQQPMSGGQTSDMNTSFANKFRSEALG